MYLSVRFITAKAANSIQASVPAAAAGGKSIVEDEDFSLAKVSFGVIGLGICYFSRSIPKATDNKLPLYLSTFSALLLL
ncbi:hypothetical protein L2E82_10215 [Cichorium intybus]|uniref:Uncharacterized protein n=2 Tax=Cichorium intybus TaxID=13427 RepID=A0ACB9G9Z4_CICIN|nr:hypothetical protein L2E82_34762 [Cichorium intybus]KAI3780244.1 hypothetical protein L2E82_10215 [Cichorium intybus]